MRRELSGQKFGRLLVNKYLHGKPSPTWECLCDCGQICKATTGNLVYGNTMSCGCFRRETIRKLKGKDITGQRFGLLLVQKLVESTNNKLKWQCLCDCGKIHNVQGDVLRRGETKSCGCQMYVKGRYRIDLTGLVVGRATVISRNIIKNGHQYYCCSCSCGKTFIAEHSHLKSGHTQSCGCYKREKGIEASTTHGLSKNKYYLSFLTRRRNDRKRKLDKDWTLEMDKLLRVKQPCCVVCSGMFKLAVDHIRPLIKGFGLAVGNACILCKHCNSFKHAKDLDQLPISMRFKITKAAKQFEQEWKNHLLSKILLTEE